MINARNHLVGDTLRDGLAVIIRVIRPEDKSKLVIAFRNLERESVYTGFFRHVRELTDQDLKRAMEIDFDREVALVVRGCEK